MPQQYKPTATEFYAYVDRLNKEDSFRLLNRAETIPLLPFTDSAQRLYNIFKTNNPQTGTGLQAVLKYDSALFAVLVLTTFVEATGEVKDSDEGWAFMIDKRNPSQPCFYSFPMNRTKNFLDTLIHYAKAFKNRIVTMPCCPECGTTLTIRLVIDDKKIMHRYTLRCPNRNIEHARFKFQSVYTGMDLVYRKFLEQKFERYFKYDQKNKENGIERTPKRLIKFNRSVQKCLHYNTNIYNDGSAPD